MKQNAWIFILTTSLMLASASRAADMGTWFSYQGNLATVSGPANGNCDFKFQLRDAAGNLMGANPQFRRNVIVSQGAFTTEVDFGAGAIDGTARWLEIAVGCSATGKACDGGPNNGQPCTVDSVCSPGGTCLADDLANLAPWMPLTPAPHALALPGLYTQQNGISSNLIGGYNGNTVTAGAIGATIGGGGNAAAPNQVTDDYATIGGGVNNQAGSAYDSIGGGAGNVTSGGFATVAGGVENQAIGTFATVGGGNGNKTGGGIASTIGGGSYNEASGLYATISGGGPTVSTDPTTSNRGLSSYGVIGGGGGNRTYIYPYATVGGGQNNDAEGAYATIAGGGPSDPINPTTTSNVVYDDYGTIGGGGGNRAGSDDGNHTNATYATVGGGDYNRALAAWSTIAGGGPTDPFNPTITNNVAYDEYCTIAGGGFNRTGSDDGDATNTRFATVGGGAYNQASGIWSTVAGGSGNYATATDSTVGGGGGNVALAAFSTACGGSLNNAGGNYATVGGGSLNNVSGDYATIPGGASNVASAPYSTVGGGGEDNPGSPSTANRATDRHSTVAGGANNQAGNANADPIDVGYCTVGGGVGNVASGNYSTIGGGIRNRASDTVSTVPGGIDNTAGGEYSFAAGRRAKVRDAATVGDSDGDQGTFVWADSTNVDFTSTGSNQFLVRASGGVGIGTAAPAQALHVSGNRIRLSNGATRVLDFRADGGAVDIEAQNTSIFIQSLGPAGQNDVILASSGGEVGVGRTPTTNKLEVEGNASKTVAGSWLANSDRSIKTDVRTVSNALDVIDELRPVSFRYTDEYRAKHPSVKDQPYFNYIAQEFREVFPDAVQDSGEDGLLQMDSYPTSVYAVAAVQELHQIVREKECVIDDQQSQVERQNNQIRELEARLTRIEALLVNTSTKGDKP